MWLGSRNALDQAAYPDKELAVAERDHAAADWCAQKFGASAVYSSPDFNEVRLGQFDVIWAGSLVTHLREEKAEEFFAFAIEHLTENGLFIITLHGRRAIANGRRQRPVRAFPEPADFEFASDQFAAGLYAFGEYSLIPGYGYSFTPLTWVERTLARHPSVTIVGFREKGWNNHQDVLVVKKASVSA